MAIIRQAQVPRNAPQLFSRLPDLVRQSMSCDNKDVTRTGTPLFLSQK